MFKYVHLDVTYWGHNWGVMLALDDATNKPLYVAFVKSETTQDYRTARVVISTERYGHWYTVLIFTCLICSLFSVPNVWECPTRTTR